MSREEELRKLVGDDVKGVKLVDDVLFLEARLEELRKMPFLRVHPKDPTRQKATPAAKMYKELLQQYTMCIRTLIKICGEDSASEDSPLRAWMRERLNNADSGRA